MDLPLASRRRGRVSQTENCPHAAPWYNITQKINSFFGVLLIGPMSILNDDRMRLMAVDFHCKIEKPHATMLTGMHMGAQSRFGMQCSIPVDLLLQVFPIISHINSSKAKANDQEKKKQMTRKNNSDSNRE